MTGKRKLWALALMILLLLGGVQTLGLKARAAGAASAAGAAPAPAKTAPARETVELSGETVEYDVNRRVSVVTGSPGTPATLVSGKLMLSGARLEYAEETGVAKVEGGVRLEQTAPDQVTLTAKSLTADLRARTAQVQGEVKMVSGKAVATADTAFFQSHERQVTLTGSPQVRSDGNLLQGKEILFFLADQRALARGGSRVTVVAEQAAKGGE